MHDNWPWTPMEFFSEGAHCTTAHMASSERELITGVWGRSPSGRAAGRGSGGRDKPPEAEIFEAFACLQDAVLLDSSVHRGWLGSRVVGVLDSGAERPGFKSQPRRCP